MLSAKLIISKIIKGLGVQRIAFSVILIACCFPAISQDNSPYSRYGLGDIVPSTNINSRGMGGIAAGYSDFLSINFNNPASYGSFQTVKEAAAKKMLYGRAILDIGLNFENRTLREPNNIEKFSASNALFSHVQVAFPLSPKWGLSFGLRPMTRISYKMNKRELLSDPVSGRIDSALTLSEGDGGSYLASVGLGHKIKLGASQSLSFGINGGYLFGKQDYSTRRSIFNDSLSYNSGNFQTTTSYGNLYFNAGLQYQTKLNQDLFLTVGVHGNWKQKLNASQDNIRETYFYDESAGYVRLDSVYDQRNIKGKIIYPGSYTAGFVIEKFVTAKQAGWLIGIDYVQNKWSDYRVYGQVDPAVRDKWELRAGAQLRPVPKTNYFSNVTYRAGAFFGPEYIYINKKLPVFGATFGLGLPILNYNRQSPGQATLINLAFEFIKRGNNTNVLKENIFRLSAGFSLSDFWFAKKKYE
jgi:hypothetical protein